MLMCKNCKYYMINLAEYLKIDNSNEGLDVENVF